MFQLHGQLYKYRSDYNINHNKDKTRFININWYNSVLNSKVKLTFLKYWQPEVGNLILFSQLTHFMEGLSAKFQ